MMNAKHFTNLVLLVVLLLIVPFKGQAQKYPTHFLGFPVDGSKETMIKNLKSVGFEYDSEEDYFTGLYFGNPVYIVLKIREYRVNRVLVYDIVQRDSLEIKKRFNKVYQELLHNKKYALMENEDARISTDENITTGISQYRKNYKAVFGQKQMTKADSIAIQAKALKHIKDVPIDNKALKANFKERCRRIHAKALARSVSTTDDRYMNQVWISITQKFGKYALIQSFDNLYNFTQPEDDEE